MREPGNSVAHQVCTVTGVRELGGHQLACRCGQVDACGLTRIENDDLVALPATLRIAEFRVEHDVNIPNEGGSHINTLNRHRFRIRFDLADCYPGCANNGDQDKDILYTRLIEVCLVNLSNRAIGAPPSPIPQAQDWCSIRRVDGNLSLIRDAFYLDVPAPPNTLPGVGLAADSQGPWTVLYRTINDVCNRTIGDLGPLDSVPGQDFRICRGGTDCLRPWRAGNVTQGDCATGEFGGIRDIGNVINVGTEFSFANTMRINYCDLQIDQNVGLPNIPHNTLYNVFLNRMYPEFQP
jgi:hypothetical protein